MNDGCGGWAMIGQGNLAAAVVQRERKNGKKEGGGGGRGAEKTRLGCDLTETLKIYVLSCMCKERE